MATYDAHQRLLGTRNADILPPPTAGPRRPMAPDPDAAIGAAMTERLRDLAARRAAGARSLNLTLHAQVRAEDL
jgi:hypothetical protein